MDSARWEKIQTLFHQAAALPVEQQLVFLESQCCDDPEIVGDVRVLLAEDARSDSVLDGDVANLAGQVLDQSPAQAAPFIRFGPYRIQRPLGEGGMGIVYLADREDLGNNVAIKILRDAWLSPARRDRFAIEQRTLAQLNHPSIARLYDADTSPDGTPFFVMEYVEGVPLTRYCADRKCTIAERVELFSSVCEAVLYAHQHAVIHRDLKPSNILVKPDGNVRLLDFGIAKHLENLGEAVDITVTGLRPMTPAYAAPEQIRGEQVGIQSDVYSLGVILYELLTGRLPFDVVGKTQAQIENILTTENPAKPSEVSDEVASPPDRAATSKMAWADLDVLCLTAMHKDPYRRYQSVEALLRDIDHHRRAEPLESRPDSTGYRLRKFLTRNKDLVQAATAALGIVVILIVFFTVRLTRARNAALAEAARTQRIQKFMTNLFQGGDAEAGPADDLRVVTLLDRGVQQAQSLNGEPDVQADLYDNLGTIYQKLGKLDRADSLLTASLKIRQSLYGSDSAQVAESLVALGLLRDDQAQLPEAEKLVRQGLEISKRRLPANHPQIAKETTALGTVLSDRGSYDQAIQTLHDAVRMQTPQGAPTADDLTSLYELANAHFYAGHYAEADSLNNQLLAAYLQMYGAHHPSVADVLINLGETRAALGDYAQAEQYDRQAVDIVEGWYGKDSPQAAIDLTILARALVYQNRYDEALDLLKQSLAIKERVYGPNHPSVASTLNELGNTAILQADYAAAEQYFTRMVSIYRSAYGEHHYLYAVALSNLATVHAKKREWASAEAIYDQAIPIFVETQSATHVNTGIARIKLGRTLLRQHRYAEAEKETRAGYDILIPQMDPGVTWLTSAREDLVEEYTALKQPDQAAKFHAELAAVQNKSAAKSGTQSAANR